MRILEISPTAQRKVAKVVAHALKRKNWYDPSRPGWMNRIPGHDKRHRCVLNTFRCVFSYTVDAKNSRVMRHLTISVPGSGFPGPPAVKEIAKMFGFTIGNEVGDDFLPSDWVFHIKRGDVIDDDCIAIGQETGLEL